MTPKNKWLVAACSMLTVAASVFLIRKNKQKDDVHEKPPKKAPQLELDNPGRQDDFLAAPSDSEVG